jgi:polyisoprenoid-binding protein YceI
MIDAPAPGLTRRLDVWDVDPVHSSVRFDVRHALTRLRGRFGDVWGVLVVAGPPERSTGHVEIAAASIDTDREGRDAFLRGEAFLHADRFPHLVFRSHAVRRVGRRRYRVDGELTIRDITRPVTAEVRHLGWTRDLTGVPRASLRVRAEVDRAAYSPSWNTLPQAVGGLLVGRTVHLDLEIQVVRRRG